MDWVVFTGKTVDEALTEALIKLETTSDNVEYEIIEKESNGILGLFSKPARIRVRVKFSISNVAKSFLNSIFKEMKLNANLDIIYNEEESTMDITINGEEMGVLIGKRGQTLDSLQYLTSLVVNKESENYIKIKLDTENYRQRRKETIENLAKNISYKVKRTKNSIALEPMNPYERRIIHSTLQYDKAVETHSEGEEPYRHVVISLKKGYRDYTSKENKGSYKNYKGYQKRPYHKHIDSNKSIDETAVTSEYNMED